MKSITVVAVAKSRGDNSLMGRLNKLTALHSVNLISWFIHLVPCRRITLHGHCIQSGAKVCHRADAGS
jgi:hypothetical protein